MSEQRLPALIDEATARLAGARTSGELLEARAIGMAAVHYAKLTKAATDTQADCLRLVVRAEILMADAIDKGQAEGVIQSHGDVQSSDIAKLPDIGVARQRLHEFRQFRDAGPAAVDDVIREVVDAGEAPTRAGILNALKGYTGDNEWYTPSEWLDLAREVMGSIDCDPASNELAQKRVGAKTWYDGTQNRDGLLCPWHGNVWLNPPYGRTLIHAFIVKLAEELANITQAIVLVDNRTDTHWFHKAASISSAIAFSLGRIGFYNREVEYSSPANGSALFYIGPQTDAFAEVFRRRCLVLFT